MFQHKIVTKKDKDEGACCNKLCFLLLTQILFMTKSCILRIIPGLEVKVETQFLHLKEKITSSIIISWPTLIEPCCHPIVSRWFSSKSLALQRSRDNLSSSSPSSLPSSSPFSSLSSPSSSTQSYNGKNQDCRDCSDCTLNVKNFTILQLNQPGGGETWLLLFYIMWFNQYRFSSTSSVVLGGVTLTGLILNCVVQ